jgi:HAE1 family hydrophobic/amphiphilic exporter-1
MISKFFIERPVLANVIALQTIVIGEESLKEQPDAQYPPIKTPTLQVTTL